MEFHDRLKTCTCAIYILCHACLFVSSVEYFECFQHRFFIIVSFFTKQIGQVFEVEDIWKHHYTSHKSSHQNNSRGRYARCAHVNSELRFISSN
jgi:hypothetical protein